MPTDEKSLSIALFTDSWFPTKSGIVTVVAQLRTALESLGHHVVIVTVTAKDREDYDTVEEEENVLKVPSIRSPLGESQYLGFPSRRKVVRFLKKHKVQLIHSHTEFFMGHAAIVVGKRMKIPVIATTHTLWEDFYKHYAFIEILPLRTVRYIVKNLYKRFYALINVSAKAKKYFTSFWILPRKACAIIPNAIDQKEFIPKEMSEQEKSELRKSLGIKDGDRVIVSIGRVVEEKRVIELWDIVSKIVKKRDNIKMLFVGSGGALGFLRERTEKSGLQNKIIFTGFIEWHKLYQYYAIGDMYVSASLSEMHSMTLLEALASGLPVVCRKDLSFQDTVFHGENGYFANTDAEEEEYLLDLVDNPEKCKEMGKKAKEVADRFTVKIHGERTVAFYKKVLEKFPERIFSKDLKEAVESVDLEK